MPESAPPDNEVNRILRWEAGETPGPWRITFFPTNRCNLHCSICWQRAAAGLDKTDETPDERLLDLVDECADAGVREWCIIGGGEPLIRGDLVMAMCERIRTRGMNGILQTNGTLLKSERAKRLMEIQWADVHVSLDGPTKEINDDIRSESSFDRAVANIRVLAELKRRHGSNCPAVSLYSVLTSTNYDKLDQMVELVRDIGCDGGIQLTTMIVHHPAADRFTLTEEHKRDLPRHLRKAMALAEEYGLRNNFGLYLQEDLVADPNAMVAASRAAAQDCAGETGMLAAMCYEPWVSVAITAEGKVGPCCAFWDPKAESIQEMSFREAWTGPYMSELRERMLTWRPASYCACCPSLLFARSQDIRRGLRAEITRRRWQQMNAAQRLVFLAAKAKTSVREHGLRAAVRRGGEWLRINVRK